MITWVLSLAVACFAYAIGNLRTDILAGSFVFHKNLKKLGKGNRFISNFRRIYGWKGVLKLALVEIVRDLVPLLVGGWVFKIKDQAAVGQAIAGVCLVLGTMYPYIYDMKGSQGIFAMIVTVTVLRTTTGILVLAVFAAVSLFTKNVPLGSIIAAVSLMGVGLIALDDRLVLKLCVLMALLLILHSIPAFLRVRSGKDERLSFQVDLSYKFDQ